MENGERPPVPPFSPAKPPSKARKRRDKAQRQQQEADGGGTAEKSPSLGVWEVTAASVTSSEECCEFWRQMGRCKFGASCRYSHGETLASQCDMHPHLLGPGSGAAARRRKAFCDCCNEKTRGGWRCTDGCDYVLCEACMKSHRLSSPPPEGRGEAIAISMPRDADAAAGPSSTPDPGAAQPAAAVPEANRRLHYVTGDATAVSQGRGSKIIAHVCNDLGRWGKGFVMAVSAKWPEVAAEYRRWHQSGSEGNFRLGAVQIINISRSMCTSGKAHAALTNASGGLAVANVIGQHGIKMGSGGPPVRYEAIREGLLTVGASALEACRLAGAAGGVPSVHMPRIGAGLAGGQWADIEPLILSMLAASPSLEAYVYDLV